MTQRIAVGSGVRLLALATIVTFACTGGAVAQYPNLGTPSPAGAPAQPAPSAAPAQTAPSTKTFSPEELNQLVAPIALYPDSLFAQVLMASTYPLEVVSAERWVKQNASLKGKALEDALQKQTWDPAVKALCAVPQVLTMMSEKLDWTQKLGDAFLAQQQELIAAAQALRKKAVDQGALKDSAEQKVVTEQVESTTVIKIEQADPQVVYVPSYDPMVVYGAWPYPSYPPYYYYPPGYVAGAAILGFTAGVIIGGALWGGINWGNNDVNINVNRYNNFNRTNISSSNWKHNAEHRGAVPYKDRGVAQQYDRAGGSGGQARDSYRGRDDGRGPSAGNMDRSGFDRGGASAGGIDRGGSSYGGGGSRDYSGRGGSAFDSGSRAQTINSSNRGASSLGSARGGGGGGARGGGGGRGGGRR